MIAGLKNCVSQCSLSGLFRFQTSVLYRGKFITFTNKKSLSTRADDGGIMLYIVIQNGSKKLVMDWLEFILIVTRKCYTNKGLTFNNHLRAYVQKLTVYSSNKEITRFISLVEEK